MKRARILECASLVVLEEGFDGLSIANVAKRLDLTAAALYWYFPSRQQLIVALQCEQLGRWREMMSSSRVEWLADERLARRHEGTRALVYLTRLATLILELPERAPELDSILGQSLDPRRWLDGDAEDELGPALLSVCHEGAKLFERADAAQALAPGDSLARAIEFWCALHGTTRFEKLARFAPELGGAHGVAVADALLRGWGASPRTLVKAWLLTNIE